MDDVPVTLQVLGAMRALGVHLAIDDFGTGDSSLSYLQRFPVETVKIDHSFVMALGDEAGAGTIVESVTALAHQLDMTVLAEGVETAAQLAIVQRAGCDQIQGYFFARPMSADDMSSRLRQAAAPMLMDCVQVA